MNDCRFEPGDLVILKFESHPFVGMRLLTGLVIARVAVFAPQGIFLVLRGGRITRYWGDALKRVR